MTKNPAVLSDAQAKSCRRCHAVRAGSSSKGGKLSLVKTCMQSQNMKLQSQNMQNEAVEGLKLLCGTCTRERQVAPPLAVCFSMLALLRIMEILVSVRPCVSRNKKCENKRLTNFYLCCARGRLRNCFVGEKCTAQDARGDYSTQL